MKRKQVYTQLSTPCTAISESQQVPLLPLKSLKSSLAKMQSSFNLLQSSTTSLGQSRTRINNRKQSKISILPLPRDKQRHKKGKRRADDSDISSSTSRYGWQTKKQMQNSAKPYIDFFTMLSFMSNKVRRRCFKLQVLIDDLIIYFSTHSELEWTREITDLLKIASLIKRKVVEDQSGQLKYEAVKQCNGELSKLFFNVAYEIYLYKHNLQNFNNLSTIHRDIEYYSRRMGLLNLTILCCMDMGRLSCEYFDLEQAVSEYSKAVKLAVFVGDKYSQEVAIDRLGMCEYYKGDMVAAHYFHNSTDKLSGYDKWKIYKYYSNQNEIQKILQAKTKEKSFEEEIKEQFFKHKENCQFNFDGMTKDCEYVQKNYDNFRNNVKQMIKLNSLRKNVPMIKKVITRAQKIGQRSYLGREYCIPRASRYHYKNTERSREEFLMSHRSYNRNNLGYESTRIDKHCRMIDQMLNFFAGQQRSQFKEIKQERESCLSEEKI